MNLDPAAVPEDTLRVVSLGNAGVALLRAGRRIDIDSYFAEAPSVGSAPALVPDRDPWPDLLLVTHAHPDHCLPSSIWLAAEQAEKSSRPMTLAGPRRALRKLEGKLPPARLVELEPREGGSPPHAVRKDFGFASVTALRTFHGQDGHNSYLIDWDGFRILHDGDNERTRPFNAAALGRIDLLCLCPWQGSDAEGLIARLKPAEWLLVHLTDEEAALHEKGRFLPDLLVRPPERQPRAARPGMAFDLKRGGV